MPVKAVDTERNRLKQQQSRARRKEYLGELEERLRRYEQQGIQASVEMQNVARRMAYENQLLRQLLSKHNISTAEIDDYLATCATGPANRIRANTDQSLLASESELARPKSGTDTVNSTPAAVANAASPITDFADVRSTEHTALPSAISKKSCDTSSSVHVDLATFEKDQISCEEAAQVIASMRGAYDHTHILPELGCSYQNKCMVKSSVVFDLS